MTLTYDDVRRRLRGRPRTLQTVEDWLLDADEYFSRLSPLWCLARWMLKREWPDGVVVDRDGRSRLEVGSAVRNESRSATWCPDLWRSRMGAGDVIEVDNRAAAPAPQQRPATGDDDARTQGAREGSDDAAQH